MANSLRAKLSSLRYKGIISDKEYHRLCKALDNEEVLDKIRAEIVDLGQRTMNDNRASGIWTCSDIIDKYREGSGKYDKNRRNSTVPKRRIGW